MKKLSPFVKKPLSYLIKGVIINNNSKLAIMQDITNNKIVFLRKGDRYQGIKIKEISATNVTLLENNELKEIKPGRQ